MVIFVTGGAGFIGSSVVRNLIKNTDHKVVNIDSLTYAGNLESLKECESSKKYFFEQIDIRSKNISGLFKTYRPDILIHLAAESHVDRSIESPKKFIETNIEGTFNLLENTRTYLESKNNNKKSSFRFHHISTDEVFGDLEHEASFFSEDSAYEPSSPYSASKAASDHLVRAWGRTFDVPILISNCSNNYGPYQFPEKLIPHMIINALKGNPLPIYGDGKQIRDWLYVDDHAEAILKVAFEGKVGETYMIGGNNQMSNYDVVYTICKILEKKVPLNIAGIKRYSDLITFVKDRPGHDRKYAVNSNKITKELNWSPAETFETGIKKTINWYIENNRWVENILSGEYILKRIGD